VQFGTGVGRAGVGDDLTGSWRSRTVSDEFVEAELLRPGDLDDAVCERAGHVLYGDGLDEHVCQARTVVPLVAALAMRR